ncbi:MAG: hypothetical protein FWG56_01940 [Desulfovibrionaceae bacterium]|jgi:antitoxin (DNA-binding transcriptional repressor) of toxin-antitoxin stability system|nr:hypothetical protein [Desulfovibrionaceae bacterium]
MQTVEMDIPKVGVREFRAGLAEFIDMNKPVAITRHGQTVGHFIPARRPTKEELARIKKSFDEWQADLDRLGIGEAEVEEMMAEVEQLRKQEREQARKQGCVP